jgi:hypothetical protein
VRACRRFHPTCHQSSFPQPPYHPYFVQQMVVRLDNLLHSIANAALATSQRPAVEPL